MPNDPLPKLDPEHTVSAFREKFPVRASVCAPDVRFLEVRRLPEGTTVALLKRCEGP